MTDEKGEKRQLSPTTIFHTRIAPNFNFTHTFQEVLNFCTEVSENWTYETHAVEWQLINQINKASTKETIDDKIN